MILDRRRIALIGLLALSGGCALVGDGRPSRTAAEEASEESVAPAPVEAASPRETGTLLPLPDRLEVYSTRTLPGGLACLLRLERLGIAHQSLSAVEGIETPVKVSGEIGGVFYRSLSKLPLVADCRLVLALHRAGPYLRNLGIEEMHFSSAYRRGSRMPSGKLSRHGLGLGIDVHAVTAREGGERLQVQDDYQRGLEDGCGGESPLLNRLACLVLRQGLFDLALTPDYDEAHYNHFHLDLAPIAGKRGKRPEPSSASDLEVD